MQPQHGQDAGVWQSHGSPHHPCGAAKCLCPVHRHQLKSVTENLACICYTSKGGQCSDVDASKTFQGQCCSACILSTLFAGYIMMDVTGRHIRCCMDLLWLALCSGRRVVRHCRLPSLLLKDMQHEQCLLHVPEKNERHGLIADLTVGLLHNTDIQCSAGEPAICRTSSMFESVSCVM